METRLLRVFREVALRGSLAEASKTLFLTPSALSHSLKALETELGGKVFDRVGNRIVLNHLGEQLLGRIDGPLDEIERAVQSVKEIEKWGQDRLRVGAAATFCQWIIPDALHEIRRTYPSMHLLVETGDTPTTLELLQQRKIDLAFGLASVTTRDVESRPVFQDELLFVYSKDHPWAKIQTLSVEEMSARPLIFYQRQSHTYGLVSEYLKERGVRPSSVMEIGSIGAMRELVKRDLGVAVLAPWVVQNDLQDGSLLTRPVGPKRLAREWRVYHLAAAPLSMAGEMLYNSCKDQAGQLLRNRDLIPMSVN